jgi:hypothetical protein
MNYPLRPLSLAEIFDGAFRLVETEWRTLIGLSLIMQIPIMLLALAAPWIFDPFAQPFSGEEEMTAEGLAAMVAGIGGLVVLYSLLYPFIAAAVTASVGNSYLGRRFGMHDAARAGLRTLFRLVASYVAWAIAYLGALMLIAGAAGLAFALGGALIGSVLESLGVVGLLVAILFGSVVVGVALFWVLFAGVVSSLLPPIAVLESNGVLGTIRRAFEIGATSKGRLIGIVMLTGLIVGFPVVGSQMLVDMIPVVGLLIWVTLQAVGFAFSTAVMVVLYFDLRCRAENFDLERLERQVEAGPGLGQE